MYIIKEQVLDSFLRKVFISLLQIRENREFTLM